MSKTIDERIVEMQFDNKQFESNVQTSLKTLDKLKQGLNLDASTKSLTNLEKAGKSFSLAHIASGIETMTSKFSALGIIGVTALQNITNSAVNAGKRIASALTIDPIKSGFQEYETQINAVQTILANTESKGKTLKDVNAALDELNKYADKTIYNFTEMTRNIGTFTAAGVDLDTSVSAIKGIANLAAVSGSTSQQASTAMYQLSQALASGTVKLMDWNSVVNAGMGGQVFQDALKETARVHGIAIDDIIKQEGSFRESLSKGWLTSEILTETLSKFTGDLNEEQLRTMGYTEEQIKSIIKMGQTANDAATKVKTFTQLFDTLKEAAQSGWTQSWEIIVGDFEEAKELLTEISNILGGMIGSSAEARNEMLQGWKDLGGRTAMIEGVRNAFNGILSIITPVKEAFREIFPPMTAEKLYAITEGFKNLTERFKIGEETANKLKRTFKGVFAVFDIGIQAISAIAKGVMNLAGSLAPAGEGILGFTANIGDSLVKFSEFIKTSGIFTATVNAITNVLKGAINIVKTFVTNVSNAFKSMVGIDTSGVDTLGEKVKAAFKPISSLGEAIKFIFNGIVSVIRAATPVITSLATKIGKVLGGIFNAIGESIRTGDAKAFLDLLNSGIITGLLLKLKDFFGGFSDTITSLGGLTDAIKEIFGGVKDSLKSLQDSLKAKTIESIAKAIGILAASLLVLSLIEPTRLTTALGAITGLFLELFASMAIFEKIMGSSGFKSIGKVTTSMIALSSAVLILSAALTNVAKLDFEGVIVGLVGVAGMCAVLAKTMQSLSSIEGKVIKGASGLILFSTAILILSEAVEKIGQLKFGDIIKGLVGVGVLCTELALFLNNTNLDSMGLSKGLGLMTLAAGITILATAVNKFAQLDSGKMIQGLIGVGIVLAELSIFVNSTGNATKVLSTAASLVIIGSAMLIFSEAIENMGSMSLAEIGKGLLTMAGGLTVIGVAMYALPTNMLAQSVALLAISTALVVLSNALNNMGSMSWEELAKSLITLAGSLTIIAVAMQFMTSALPGAAALLVVSGALLALAPALLIFGSMSLAEIGKGLLTIAGVFVIFGVAGAVLGPLVPVLLGLGGAIALLGAGCLAAGAGVLALGTGLTVLATSFIAFGSTIDGVVKWLIELIPYILEQLGKGIIALCDVIGNSTTSICAAITSVLLALLNAIKDCTPALIDTLDVLLTNILDFLVANVPKMVDAGLKLIVGLLNGISDNIGDVIKAGVQVVSKFMEGVAGALPDVIFIGFKCVISFINGLADAIRNNDNALGAAARNLINAFIEAIGSLMGSMTGIGKDLVSGIIKGVGSMAGSLATAAKNLAKNALSSIKKALGINSPSKEGIEIGEFLDEGLIKGIQKASGDVTKAAKDLGDDTIKTMTDAVSKVGNLANSDMNLNPTITPVLDMSSVNGASLDTSKMENTIENLSNKADSLNSQISYEEEITVTHKFETLRVEGVNDQGEFVAAADYAVEEMLTELMRRQNRL